MISELEQLMYEVSNTLLTPVLLMIVALFMYSIFQTGVFFTQMFKRRKHFKNYKSYVKEQNVSSCKGYPIMNYLIKEGYSSIDDIEIFAYKKLENTSIITKISPMLGLVATMIPMGPALKSLAAGNVQGISDNLVVAFAAVIFALITAATTYWITSVRKRWYAQEIKDIMEMHKDK